jgi:hypothetical protein
MSGEALGEALGESLDIYKKEHIAAVCVSLLFVSLFFITQAIDLNKVLIDFGVSDNVITRAKLLYVYTIGYVLFVIKFIIALVTFVLLTMIIVIIIASLISVVRMNKDKTLDENQNKFYETIAYWIINIGRYKLSFIAVKQFILIYVLMIPIFLFFFYLFYILILYNPKKIEDDENKSNIMNTNHMYLYFLFVSLCLMAFIYLCFVYAMEEHV